MQEEFGYTRKQAALMLGLVVFILCQPVIFFINHGYLDEMDYWAGTFGLVILATVEIILFAWIFGMKKGWDEITRGADIRVPLIFHFTDRRAEPRRIKGLSRLVDLGPTLAELVGDSFDAQMIPIEGRSFLPVVKGDRNSYAVDSSFAQRRPTDRKQLREGWRKGDVYSLLTSRYKLIIHTGSGNELYDLESDPLEQVNIIEDAPVEVVEHLVEQLSEQYRRMTGQGERLQLGPIDPEHIEELKALGYL